MDYNCRRIVDVTRIIDLTHPIEHGSLGYPGDPAAEIAPLGSISSVGYNTTRISLSSHHGTHLDAPFHFFDEGKTLDQLPLEWFYGPARVVDLAPSTALEPGTEITRAMLEPFAEAFQPGARVLLRTGWDQRFGTPEFYEEHPSLALDAARWIASRRIRLLGVDMPSPSLDPIQVHRVFLAEGSEIVLVEALANLHMLPGQVIFCAFPLKIIGGDGSPVRAVAIVED